MDNDVNPRELHGNLLTVYCDLAVLRMLVESVLMTMSLEDQAVAMLKFQQSCERTLAHLLGDPIREELLNEMQHMIESNQRRLARQGFPLPE